MCVFRSTDNVCPSADKERMAASNTIPSNAGVYSARLKRVMDCIAMVCVSEGYGQTVAAALSITGNEIELLGAESTAMKSWTVTIYDTCDSLPFSKNPT